MALSDYQRALQNIYSTPSSVQAIPSYTAPTIQAGQDMGQKMQRGVTLSNDINRSELINKQEQRETSAYKNEYRATLPFEFANIGAELFRTRTRTLSELQKDRDNMRMKRREDAIIRALTESPEKYKQASALPSMDMYNSMYVGPQVPMYGLPQSSVYNTTSYTPALNTIGGVR